MKWNVGQIRSYPNRMLIPIFVKKSISSLILTSKRSDSENSSLAEAITKMRDMIKAMEEELERVQDKEDE